MDKIPEVKRQIVAAFLVHVNTNKPTTLIIEDLVKNIDKIYSDQLSQSKIDELQKEGERLKKLIEDLYLFHRCDHVDDDSLKQFKIENNL